MNVTEAIDQLGQLLDVTEDRYPNSTRILHINQSLAEIAREFETRMNEGVGNVVFTAGSTSQNMGSLIDETGQQLSASVVEAAYYVQDYTTTGGVRTINEDWKKLTVFPSYELLLDSTYVDLSQTGDLIGIAQHGDLLYMANKQTDDTLIRIIFRGVPRYESVGEPAWLRIAPWAVIYHCAQIACVWLEDEGRIPVYERLYQRAAEIVNLEDSMRGDVPMQTTEA